MPAIDEIADNLKRLLGAELSSPFARAVEARLHAARSGAGVRRTMAYVADADRRRAHALWTCLASLGLDPEPPAGPRRPGDNFESFLSIEYVLPRLADAKQHTLQAYRDAIAGLDGVGDPVSGLLRRHLTEHAGELQLLLGES